MGYKSQQLFMPTRCWKETSGLELVFSYRAFFCLFLQMDYRRTIVELDEKEYISLKLCCCELKNHYVSFELLNLYIMYLLNCCIRLIYLQNGRDI